MTRLAVKGFNKAIEKCLVFFVNFGLRPDLSDFPSKWYLQFSQILFANSGT